MIFSDVNSERTMLRKSKLTIIVLRRKKKKLRKNSMTISLEWALALPRIIDNNEYNFNQFVNRVDISFHFQLVS